MSRPTKTGLEYFPMDVYNDDKLNLIEAEFGLIGWAVVVRLYARIYRNGYFTKWTLDEELLFSREINIEKEKIDNIVMRAIERNIFDLARYEDFNILTSRGIQKRYFESSKRRKEVEIDKNYLMIDVSSYENLINVNNNEENDNINPQSKVKESKVNKPSDFAIGLSKFVLEQSIKNGYALKYTQSQIESGAKVLDQLQTEITKTDKSPAEAQRILTDTLTWAVNDTELSPTGFCWAKNFRSCAGLKTNKGNGRKWDNIYAAYKGRKQEKAVQEPYYPKLN